jgi:hypothetical protein
MCHGTSGHSGVLSSLTGDPKSVQTSPVRSPVPPVQRRRTVAELDILNSCSSNGIG